MNWKIKSMIQNTIARLPSTPSYATYYWLQKYFGELRRANPVDRLKAAVEICKIIEQLGQSPVDKTFLEVGTGRTLLAPLAFWLAGAKRIITVDINPYLKEELVRSDLDYIRQNHTEIEYLFERKIFDTRLTKLIEFSKYNWQMNDLLKLLNIEYIAPGDASQLSLSSYSVDFHTSNTVFEHIPANELQAILKEGLRVVNSDGIFIHRIDMSDHFSHSDKLISKINFLQFDNAKWDRLAGNRYSYMNRLRLDDFVNLYKKSNHKILMNIPDIDTSLYEIIRKDSFKISSEFSNKSEKTLATTGAWIVSIRENSCEPSLYKNISNTEAI